MPEQQRSPRPAKAEAPKNSTAAVTTILPKIEHAHEFGRGWSATDRAALNRRVMRQLGDGLELILRQAARRFIQQTLAEALPVTWLRRAEQFEQVGTPAADEMARNCRRHAWLLASDGLPDGYAAEVADLLAVV